MTEPWQRIIALIDEAYNDYQEGLVVRTCSP